MSRKPDNAWEAWLLERLREIFGEEAAKPAAKRGDAQTPGFQWEHKYRGTDGFTVSKDHRDKIAGRAALFGNDWVLVVRNKHGQRVAVMDVEALLRLIKEVVKRDG